jgi:hypothetical protein
MNIVEGLTSAEAHSAVQLLLKSLLIQKPDQKVKMVGTVRQYALFLHCKLTHFLGNTSLLRFILKHSFVLASQFDDCSPSRVEGHDNSIKLDIS